jgi:hypothetical protein
VVVLGKPGGSMSEKYYIVSESELQSLQKSSSGEGWAYGSLGFASKKRKEYVEKMKQAEAVCRARPVVRELDQESMIPSYIWREEEV